MRNLAKPIKLPRGYLSWSQLWLWEHNPEEYKRHYFEDKKKEEESPKMKFGKKFAESREKNKSCEDPLAELARIFTPSMPIKEVEITAWLMLDNQLKIKLLGKPDGFDKKSLTLVEDKTGAKWTQGMVDKHGQITFYSLIIWLKTKKLLKRIFLNFIPTEVDEDGKVSVCGKARTFQTERKLSDLFLMVNRIAKAAKEINKEYEKYLKSLKKKK